MGVKRLKITTWSEARAAGQVRYYTGKPCKYGHISERYVGQGHCITCLNNPAVKAKKDKKYRERYPVKIRVRIRKWVAELRIKCLARLGNACKCCGETREEFLTFDHRNGGGKLHRGNDTKRFYRWILLAPIREVRKVIRILCWNCNCVIGARGYCPHQREKRRRTC